MSKFRVWNVNCLRLPRAADIGDLSFLCSAETPSEWWKKRFFFLLWVAGKVTEQYEIWLHEFSFQEKKIIAGWAFKKRLHLKIICREESVHIKSAFWHLWFVHHSCNFRSVKRLITQMARRIIGGDLRDVTMSAGNKALNPAGSCKTYVTTSTEQPEGSFSSSLLPRCCWTNLLLPKSVDAVENLSYSESFRLCLNSLAKPRAPDFSVLARRISKSCTCTAFTALCEILPQLLGIFVFWRAAHCRVMDIFTLNNAAKVGRSLGGTR